MSMIELCSQTRYLERLRLTSGGETVKGSTQFMLLEIKIFFEYLSSVAYKYKNSMIVYTWHITYIFFYPKTCIFKESLQSAKMFSRKYTKIRVDNFSRRKGTNKYFVLSLVSPFFQSFNAMYKFCARYTLDDSNWNISIHNNIIAA